VLAVGGPHAPLQLWSLADPADPVLLDSVMIGSARNGIDRVATAGSMLAVGRVDDGQVQLWNVADPGHPIQVGRDLSAGGGGVQGLSLSAHGTVLAAGDADGTVTVWSLADPAAPAELGQPLPAGGSAVTALTMSPDGKTLVVGQASDQVDIFELADLAGPPILAAPSAAAGTVNGSALALSVSSDGSTLAEAASASQSPNLASLAAPSLALGNLTSVSGQFVSSVAFAPDGIMAYASNDGQLLLVDAHYGGPSSISPVQVGPELSSADTTAVQALAFDPDGDHLVAGSQDGSVRIWSLPGTTLDPQFPGSLTAAGSPDGQLLAAAGSLSVGGGTLALWSLTADQRPALIFDKAATADGYCLGVAGVQFGDDGRYVMSGCAESAGLWSLRNPAAPQEVRVSGPPGAFSAVALSPTAPIVVGLDDAGNLELWDLRRSLSAPVAQAAVAPAGGAQGQVISFDPNGRYLAMQVEDNNSTLMQIQLWAISTTDRLRLVSTLNWPDPEDSAYSMAFTPDGRDLAVGDVNGGIRLAGISPSGGLAFSGPAVETAGTLVTSLSFDTEGDTLAATDGNDIWLWHDEEGSLSLEGEIPVDGDDSVYAAVSFIPDSRTLVSDGGDVGIELWNLDPSVQTQSAWICASTTGVLTRQNWATYISAPYVPTCGT
jgi:WD40 repeat protein